jgi:serine/threonine protein kinase
MHALGRRELVVLERLDGPLRPRGDHLVAPPHEQHIGDARAFERREPVFYPTPEVGFPLIGGLSDHHRLERGRHDQRKPWRATLCDNHARLFPEGHARDLSKRRADEDFRLARAVRSWDCMNASASEQSEHDAPVLAGKYRLLRRLGVGGMGAVWLAFNEATGAEVAVKVLLEADTSAELVERLRREAHATARLSHRGIVRIYDLVDLGPSGDQVAIVMELLHGRTLADHLSECGKLPLDEVVAIALQLLSALAHAHGHGVVHRDLKPENVFLAVDPDGMVTPKILDFGISKLRLPLAPVITQEGEMLGTPSYMSPEQVRGPTEVDGRSDLFNVGILMYEMLSGHNPFDGGGLHTVLASIMEAHPRRVAEAPLAVWCVIERALRKSPEDRFATANELAAALRTAVGLPAPASYPPQASPLAGIIPPEKSYLPSVFRPPPPARRRVPWRLVGAAVGAAVAASAVAAVLALAWTSTAPPGPAAAMSAQASLVETPLVVNAGANAADLMGTSVQHVLSPPAATALAASPPRAAPQAIAPAASAPARPKAPLWRVARDPGF